MLDRVDLALAAVMAGATVGVFLLILAVFGDSLARLGITGQLLEADGFRVLGDSLDPEGVHWRLTVHPLYCLLVMPVARAFVALGASRLQAIWICNAATAAASVSLLYTIQRLLGSPRRAAVLVCLLALSSSSLLFWTTVPETYLLGALSLLACFATAAAAARGSAGDLWFLLSGIFSLGITITNWSAGIALAAFHRPLNRAAAIVAATAAITIAGWFVEKALFTRMPSFFLKPTILRGEADYLVAPRGALAGELVHPVVAPLGVTVEKEPGFRVLSFQGASILAAGRPAVAAAVAWLLVLAAGLAALVRGPAPARFRLMLGMVLAAQVVLHLIYGDETFLYAFHFWALLMLTAGLAVQADRAGFVQGAVAATILFGSWNNVLRLSEAAKLPLDQPTQWLKVIDRPLRLDEFCNRLAQPTQLEGANEAEARGRTSTTPAGDDPSQGGRTEPEDRP
ncbi:hypothetical protein [Paludisphaera rhizosphaerae]|uniref:hypothetical protein n=1 Tax=Paludisphaera rhizosphaerae TaxID=2711216 RepID=UPI0013EA9A1F|nr:hypothetical protein [Paludisphaera rhizosphaerae]